MYQRPLHRISRFPAILAGLALLVPLTAASAMSNLRLEPSDTSVAFDLDTTFHDVHGTMEVLEGDIRFDPTSRKVSGRVVVDATSASTEHAKRDKKMHRQVLESDRYPRIVFQPRSFEGVLDRSGDSDLRINGTIEIHGSAHEVQIPTRVRLAGDSLTGTAHFTVPYVEWGMKDPSVLMFRAGKEVRIVLSFVGTVAEAGISSLPASSTSSP